MWTSAAISFLMFCCAIGLMVSHRRTWRLTGESESDENERDFRWRQYRRRMQTSAMMGILVVAAFFGQFISKPPMLVIGFWAGVLLLVIWIGLLAAADYYSSRHHLSRLQHNFILEQAKLHAEARRIRAVQGNGRHPKNHAKKRTKPDSEAE
jgi:Na+/H+ antiporter NhaD/arsenite permease-like protein